MKNDKVKDMSIDQIYEVIDASQGVGSDYEPNSVYVLNTTKITNGDKEDAKMYVLDEFAGTQAVIKITIDEKHTIIDLTYNSDSSELLTVNQRLNKYLDYVGTQTESEAYSILLTVIPKKYEGAISLGLFNPIYFGVVKDSTLNSNREVVRLLFENESIEVYGIGEN